MASSALTFSFLSLFSFFSTSDCKAMKSTDCAVDACVEVANFGGAYKVGLADNTA